MADACAHEDAPPCPECRCPTGTPAEEAGRGTGPGIDGHLWCPACGHKWWPTHEEHRWAWSSLRAWWAYQEWEP